MTVKLEVFDPALPLILLDGRVVSHGRYPDRRCSSRGAASINSPRPVPGATTASAALAS